jgi:hypothetical protein
MMEVISIVLQILQILMYSHGDDNVNGTGLDDEDDHDPAVITVIDTGIP